MRKYNVYPTNELEEKLIPQLYWVAQRQDCAEWDWEVPLLPISIDEKYVKDSIIQWFQWELIVNLYWNWNNKTLRFNPNGCTVEERL